MILCWHLNVGVVCLAGMQRSHKNLLQLALLTAFLSMGAHCGPPTDLDKERARILSPCEEKCQKAHSRDDARGRSQCLRVCLAQEELRSSY